MFCKYVYTFKIGFQVSRDNLSLVTEGEYLPLWSFGDNFMAFIRNIVLDSLEALSSLA